MNDIIKIKVQALNWTMGEHAYFDLLVEEGTEIRVDWDDGHISTANGQKDWLELQHYYSEKQKRLETIFIIKIEADGENKIRGLRNNSIDMHVMEDDASGCPGLEILEEEFIDKLDVTANVQLRELNIRGIESETIDLSKNVNLEILNCRQSELKSLNLTKCKKLWFLDCTCCFKLSQLGLGNASSLREFHYCEDTPIKETCMKFIEETIKRNNGTIEKYTYDDEDEEAD